MDQHNLNLTALPEQIRDSAEAFTTTLTSEIADNLRSITIVGSSLNDDFRPGLSDINTVVVLGERTLAALNTIAALARPMSKKKIASPLLMTTSYIERSLDVFGVEFLDFQLTHQTILGDDPFAALIFDKKDVRLQCERELKAMLIRLRQGYITSAANRRVVQDILISTVKGLAPILRAMFWLKGIDRPNTAEPTIHKAAEVFSLSTDAIAAAESWRRQKTRISEEQMQETFEATYTNVEQLSVIVDELQL
jgi:hypothetical protein